MPPLHFTMRSSGAEQNRLDNFVGGGRRTEIDKNRDPPRGPRSQWDARGCRGLLAINQQLGK